MVLDSLVGRHFGPLVRMDLEVEGRLPEGSHPPPHANRDEEYLHTLCPMRVIYVEHMVAFQPIFQPFFVCHIGRAQGEPGICLSSESFTASVIRSAEVMRRQVTFPQQCLRELMNQRLTAAAEEIFTVFQKTIVEFEEEIDRQRKLLDIVWKPEIRLHRTELPQQHVCKEEEIPADQQLCNQERNSSLDREDPEPPQIKEEQEELCTSLEGEQL
eukprot:superscaffoldBa00004717_g19339